jgi:hypothetical protein
MTESPYTRKTQCSQLRVSTVFNGFCAMSTDRQFFNRCHRLSHLALA